MYIINCPKLNILIFRGYNVRSLLLSRTKQQTLLMSGTTNYNVDIYTFQVELEKILKVVAELNHEKSSSSIRKSA